MKSDRKTERLPTGQEAEKHVEQEVQTDHTKVQSHGKPPRPTHVPLRGKEAATRIHKPSGQRRKRKESPVRLDASQKTRKSKCGLMRDREIKAPNKA